MKNLDDEKLPSLLTSDLVIAGFLGDIEIDGFGSLSKLDAAALRSNADEDAKAKRFELITAARGGKHIELSVTAQTFAQTKKANRRYMRLGEDNLESGAKTWKNQPYLIDHATWRGMDAQKGNILSSKATEIDGGTGFEQKLHAVKPDAVIGILDGTFGKFSIGWWADGPILCSVHNSDIMKLDGCSCWPGDKVTLADGRERTVEFIYTKFIGKETSSVVIPAVQDTHVDDVRAQLAAELGITNRLTRTTIPVAQPKETGMRFPRVAAALQLAADSDLDENTVAVAVEALRQRALTAETKLSTNEQALAQATSAIAALTAAVKGREIQAALDAHGYAAGKLRYGRDGEGKQTPSPMEGFLRTLGAADKGIELMKAQLKEMPLLVPVGQRPQAEGVKDPARLEVVGDEIEYTEDNPYLQSVAEQLNIPVADMLKFAGRHISREAQ